MEPATNDDEIPVYWMGVFDSRGRITNSIVGSYSLRCAFATRRVQFHMWDCEVCRVCAPPPSLVAHL